MPYEGRVADRSRKPDGIALEWGHYHGAHSRRVDRYIIGVVFAVILFKPVTTGTIFNSAWITTTLILAVALAFCEWWFVRRRGVDVGADRLTLHYFYGRTHLPWHRIESFQWGTRLFERGEYLTVVLKDGGKMWLPTIGRASSQSTPGDFFGSSNIRSKGGDEVDAVDALEGVLASAREKEVGAGAAISG
jgi:Bacterial PH domain